MNNRDLLKKLSAADKQLREMKSGFNFWCDFYDGVFNVYVWADGRNAANFSIINGKIVLEDNCAVINYGPVKVAEMMAIIDVWLHTEVKEGE